ncbi:hypothetical protein EDC04DRAFT_2806415, partial [Pisolithus marmoratus]
MYLMKYLAKYCPCKQGRAEQHVQGPRGKRTWHWARHHMWRSWRGRYKKSAKYFKFDPKIL